VASSEWFHFAKLHLGKNLLERQYVVELTNRSTAISAKVRRVGMLSEATMTNRQASGHPPRRRLLIPRSGVLDPENNQRKKKR